MAKSKNSTSAASMDVMLTVVTGEKASQSKGYFKIESKKSPAATYDALQALGIINKGDFSGVSFDKTQKYKEEEKWVETKPRAWVPEERNWADSLVPAHWEEAEGYHEKVSVPDGFTTTTLITKSARADIRQQDGCLFLAVETLNKKALQKCYGETIKKAPVENVLGALLSKANADSLMKAFNAVSSFKSLSVKDALDDNKVKALQGAHKKAVENVKKAVQVSGLSRALPQGDVQALVKRACNLTFDL